MPSKNSPPGQVAEVVRNATARVVSYNEKTGKATSSGGAVNPGAREEQGDHRERATGERGNMAHREVVPAEPPQAMPKTPDRDVNLDGKSPYATVPDELPLADHRELAPDAPGQDSLAPAPAEANPRTAAKLLADTRERMPAANRVNPAQTDSSQHKEAGAEGSRIVDSFVHPDSRPIGSNDHTGEAPDAKMQDGIAAGQPAAPSQPSQVSLPAEPQLNVVHPGTGTQAAPVPDDATEELPVTSGEVRNSQHSHLQDSLVHPGPEHGMQGSRADLPQTQEALQPPPSRQSSSDDLSEAVRPEATDPPIDKPRAKTNTDTPSARPDDNPAKPAGGASLLQLSVSARSVERLRSEEAITAELNDKLNRLSERLRRDRK